VCEYIARRAILVETARMQMLACVTISRPEEKVALALEKMHELRSQIAHLE